MGSHCLEILGIQFWLNNQALRDHIQSVKDKDKDYIWNISIFGFKNRQVWVNSYRTWSIPTRLGWVLMWSNQRLYMGIFAPTNSFKQSSCCLENRFPTVGAPFLHFFKIKSLFSSSKCAEKGFLIWEFWGMFSCFDLYTMLWIEVMINVLREKKIVGKIKYFVFFPSSIFSI